MSDKIVSFADENRFEIVMEISTGRVLYESCSSVKRAMASTTKILTAITAIENFDIKKVISVNAEWTGIEGSSIYLKEGETFNAEELLYGLMLRSGNDCAVALACGLAGSIENFVALMNQTAVNAGANCSNFVNPHGLSAKDHYTTAYDLALITCYAMKNEVFKTIVSTKSKTIGQGQSRRVLNNKNKLLSSYAYCTGVKTGYTKEAGRCLVSAANKNGFEVVCVVLNCGPMFERSVELIEQAYSKYSYATVACADKPMGETVLKNGVAIQYYVKNSLCYPLAEGEIDKLRYKINIDENIRCPIKFEQKIGNIKIYLENRLLFDEKLYTILGVSENT